VLVVVDELVVELEVDELEVDDEPVGFVVVEVVVVVVAEPLPDGADDDGVFGAVAAGDVAGAGCVGRAGEGGFGRGCPGTFGIGAGAPTATAPVVPSAAGSAATADPPGTAGSGAGAPNDSSGARSIIDGSAETDANVRVVWVVGGRVAVNNTQPTTARANPPITWLLCVTAQTLRVSLQGQLRCCLRIASRSTIGR
jgi:hypothetical protein